MRQLTTKLYLVLSKFFTTIFSDRAEIILKWLVFISGLAGSIFGLYQYWSHNHSLKIERSQQLYHKYINIENEDKSLKKKFDSLIPYDDESSLLADVTNCCYVNYKDSATNTNLKDNQLLNCSEIKKTPDKLKERLNGPQKKDGETIIPKKVHEAVLKDYYNRMTHEKEKTLFFLLYFFISVADCMNYGGCDSRYIISTMSKDMVELLNSYCGLFKSKADFANETSPDTYLADALLAHGLYRLYKPNLNEKRQHIFFCDHLVHIEKQYRPLALIYNAIDSITGLVRKQHPDSESTNVDKRLIDYVRYCVSDAMSHGTPTGGQGVRSRIDTSTLPESEHAQGTDVSR